MCAHGPGGEVVTIDERPPPPREPLEGSAVAGLEELVESTEALRRELVTHEEMCRRVLSDVRDGVQTGSVLAAVGADTWRAAMTDAIKEFETTRRRVRLVLVTMSLEEGSSIAEIARTWGVSRQLASRWAQEAAPLRPACDPVDPMDRELQEPRER